MRKGKNTSEKAAPKKAKVSRAELAALKEKLGAQLEIVYSQVMRFCTDRPPNRAVSGSYQEALEYKDSVSKARSLACNTNGSPNQLQARINRLKDKLTQFQNFE